MSERSVLVVDDEESLTELYASILSENYETLTAYDGEEALDVIDDSVDVVLLDRRLPTMSGDEVLAEIRDRGYDVRVAMTTAADPDIDIVNMDFESYVTKPLRADELRETVEKLLTLSRYDDRATELFSVVEKRTTLEATRPEWELDASEEYQALRERQAELEEETASLIAEGGDEFLRESITACRDGA